MNKRITIALLFSAASLCFNMLGAIQAAGLNDTGITTRSNATQNGLPCPVAGFPRQDAEFGSNGLS